MKRKIIICFLLSLFFSATVFAGTLCFFEGNVNFIQRIFQMQINFKGNEKIATQLKFLPDDSYYFNANLEHIKIANFDVSSNFESSGRLLKDDKGKGKGKVFKGWFWSNYSLLNYKPFREMSGAFELDQKSKRLSLSSFAWGGLEINGSIDLTTPFNLNLVLVIKDMEAKELATILGISTEDIEIGGLISGKLKIEGVFSNPKIRGQIKASQGIINEFKYKDIFLNLEGSYPLLNIVDSRIIEENSMPYSLAGKLDLRGLNNLKAQGNSIKIFPSEKNSFNWQSWNIRRKLMSDSDDKLELEYKLKPNRPFGIRFEDNQEIIGFGQKIKF